ncbi:MAG: RidA family protein [Alphaproteobacteria bacterium]|nr:RidA family protein [Alphaproteobacteria bacterium]MCD8520103.1 RidA family protein [Alphaproteobacteria bacterium]MCD8525879.1 RidA family protein [Alphaproteobacteria bacterium]MCD8570739.1 RidA family protein [Alphaproteobacteria bacterium]
MSIKNIAEKLKTLGYDLPEAAAPAANYVPYVISGKQVFVAGQIPFLNGQPMHIGKVGDTFSLEQGVEAAKACALNILAQVNAAVGGDWSKVKRCVKLGAFVNSTPDFTDQPVVVNGASDLMVEVLGEAGKHARFALSAASLPKGVAVEIDAIFELN